MTLKPGMLFICVAVANTLALVLGRLLDNDTWLGLFISGIPLIFLTSRQEDSKPTTTHKEAYTLWGIATLSQGILVLLTAVEVCVVLNVLTFAAGIMLELYHRNRQSC